MRKFELTDSEEDKVFAFKEQHKECTKNMPDATDGKYPFTYSFTPGGIGTVVKVRCNGCGKETNITDYDNW